MKSPVYYYDIEIECLMCGRCAQSVYVPIRTGQVRAIGCVKCGATQEVFLPKWRQVGFVDTWNRMAGPAPEDEITIEMTRVA